MRSVSEAVADELAAMPEALRESARAAVIVSLADRLDGRVESPAAVAKQLREALAELEAMARASAPEGDAVDDLAAAREARRADAAG